MPRKPIPIIDIFAGPGGLGEGFSRVADQAGNPVFQTTLSIEKEALAHRTLMLRAFARLAKRTSGPAWKDYRLRLGHDISEDQLFAKHADLAKHAANEAWHQELGPDTAADVRRRIDAMLPDQKQDWLLIGGPPCQAYSLVGRSRNKGKAKYVFEKDDRAQLYLEYLQILADHRPAVFVMENVKGLLSATFHAESMFELIRRDLQEPATALGEAGRASRFRPKYELYSVSPNRDGEIDLFGERIDAASFLVRAEAHGTPQARHRVIVVGIRKDLEAGRLGRLARSVAPTVLDTIGDLPPLRSGLSSGDSADQWRKTLQGFPRAAWWRQSAPEVRARISRVSDQAIHADSGRGGEALLRENPPQAMPRWFGGSAQGLKWVWQHSSRGHIPEDLARYLFAAAWAEEHGSSPHLAEFPVALLPEHRNAKAAAAGGAFSDRFRVQLGDRVATTITSHISKDGHYYIHPDPSQCRSLTVREAARLQTFPDDYFFCGPRTGQYIQVGNAVPPYLAWQIAKLLGEALGRSCDRHPIP
jgi:DNA (cytosine-5)-methyltransferase 1